MIKHKGILRERCGAINACVPVAGEYYESATGIVVIVPLILLLNFDGCRAFFLIDEFPAGGDVTRQMDGYLVCPATLPVDGYALVLEQIRQSPLYGCVVVDDVALLGPDECADTRPGYDDLPLAGLEP